MAPDHVRHNLQRYLLHKRPSCLKTLLSKPIVVLSTCISIASVQALAVDLNGAIEIHYGVDRPRSTKVLSMTLVMATRSKHLAQRERTSVGTR